MEQLDSWNRPPGSGESDVVGLDGVPRDEPEGVDVRDEDGVAAVAELAGDDIIDLIVTGWWPVCLVCVNNIFVFSALVFIEALQVLAKHRHVITPFLVEE